MPSDTPLAAMSDEELEVEFDRREMSMNAVNYELYVRRQKRHDEFRRLMRGHEATELSRRVRRSTTHTIEEENRE